MNRLLPIALTAAAACAPKESEVLGSIPAEAPPSLTEDRITTEDHLAAEDQAHDALERLDALELLVVDELIVDAPEGATNCYGPCYQDADWQPFLKEHARQVRRLQAFVELAEEVVQAPPVQDAGYDASVA